MTRRLLRVLLNLALFAACLWLAYRALTFDRPDTYNVLLYREIGRLGPAAYSHPYADFPPLKAGLFVLVESVGNLGWRAFAWTLLLGFGLALWLYLRPGGPPVISLGIYVGLAVSGNFWALVEDKALYGALFLGSLVAARAPTPRRLALAGLLLGLLQSYGGPGLFLVPVLALALPTWRSRLLLGSVALIVALGSHALYFPDWLAGYARRAARMRFDPPIHQSLWLPASWLGLYRPWMPTAATALLTVLGWLAGLRFRRVGLTLVWVAGLGLGPEASTNRLAGVLLPLIPLAAPLSPALLTPSSPRRSRTNSRSADRRYGLPTPSGPPCRS